jgi:zinc protease
VTVPPLSLGGEQRERREDDVRLPRVYLGFRAPAYGQRGWYAADLLAASLSGGKSSRLFQDLVYNRQIAQDVGVYISPYEEVATFMVISSARPGVEVETLEKALIEHLDRAATELPAPEDLERARNRMLTEYYTALQKLDNRADLFSQFTTFFDNPGGIEWEIEQYQEIEGRDLLDFASQHLVESERVVLTFVPRGGQE